MAGEVLVSTRRAPYGDSLAHDALNVALTYAAFGKAVSLLFLDDGVLQLLSGQAPESLTRKNLAKILQSLTLYDIDKLYADESAMLQRGMSVKDSILPVELLTADAIAALIAEHKTVLSF